jgi:hypothetical protein
MGGKEEVYREGTPVGSEWLNEIMGCSCACLSPIQYFPMRVCMSVWGIVYFVPERDGSGWAGES